MARALALLLTFAVVACRPSLPLPHEDPGSATDPPLALTFEPEATADAAPPVLRIHLDLPADFDLTELAVVQGDVGAESLRSIVSGDVSDALAKRIVPSVIWRAAAGDVVIAPETSLELGTTYSVAAPPASLRFHVSKDAIPIAAKVWPPAGASATNGFAAWCGDDALAEVSLKSALEPGDVEATFTRGVDEGIGLRCLSLRASPDPTASLVAPPVIDVGAAQVTLAPGALAIEAPAAKTPALGCEEGEAAFGPGCARVLDDRVLVRSPDAPLLWGVANAHDDTVAPLAASEGFNVLGLAPSSPVALSVASIDTAGVATRTMFTATTGPPSGHLEINEVMANPIGPEPAEEWVELVNDGLVAATASGLAILDDTGATALPDLDVAPGQTVLIVPDAFVVDDGVDVPPAPGTTLVRVPKLGDHGLSNEGEALRLVDAKGAVLSRFPASPKPKSGLSVARLTPGSSDLAASSFHLAKPTPGAMNPTP